MRRASRTAIAAGVLVVFGASCSEWESGEHGVTYTFTNHCNEDVVVEALSGGEPVTVPAGEIRTVRTFAQEPDEAFVVRRPDGTDDLQVAPGTATYALEGDDCPSDH